jgi:hypothetical protein
MEGRASKSSSKLPERASLEYLKKLAKERLRELRRKNPEAAVRVSVDLYTAHYGQREFGIRDPNGLELMFTQPME